MNATTPETFASQTVKTLLAKASCAQEAVTELRLAARVYQIVGDRKKMMERARLAVKEHRKMKVLEKWVGIVVYNNALRCLRNLDSLKYKTVNK